MTTRIRRLHMYQDRTSSVYPIHRPQTNVSPKLTLFLTSLCVSWLCISWVGSNWVASQETKSNQKTRTLFVPYEDLNILFDGSSQHVYLSKKEYEDLIVKAKPVPVEKAPRSFVYTNVTHEASITGELARIKSRLTIESMEDHLLAIPIPFRGVSLQAAAHADGSQAPLGKNRNGQTVVFLKGKKKHQLDLEFVGLVKLETAKQSLDFQLPPAALAKLDVSVNGNVELAEGPAVISRTYDQASNRTAFGLVPSRGMTSLVMWTEVSKGVRVSSPPEMLISMTPSTSICCTSTSPSVSNQPASTSSATVTSRAVRS